MIPAGYDGALITIVVAMLGLALLAFVLLVSPSYWMITGKTPVANPG